MNNLMIKLGQMVAEDPDPDPEIKKVLQGVEATIHLVINILTGVALACVTLFAFYIIFKFVRADEEQKRTEAKKQLLWCLIAIIGVTILIILFNTVIKDALKTYVVVG